MSSNTAAWLTAAKATPFSIESAPLGRPEDGQILIKNYAWAINPIDGKMQKLAFFPLSYPTILGQDVAGEVVAVGSNVTRFKKGDRVTGFASGFVSKRNHQSGFQAYTVLETGLTSEIPDNISFEAAVVLPLAVSTAASGLFLQETLNLRLPTSSVQEPAGKLLLVWGGASSVGLNAIQLAVAAGYEVITTASPKNFDYVTRFGASQVFDYKSPTIVSELINAAKGKTIVGVFDAVGGASFAPAVQFVQGTAGAKIVVTAAVGFPQPPEGIVMKQTQSYWIKDTFVGKAIWEDFLPKALKASTYLPGPEPLIAGKGLESLQEAVNLQREGTSAQKVVVLL
jgi:NADPH:quinone reductase-like Zn-dependent oxidoreductase